jgi:4-amino-4-deoxy-L-arabinose transferase-like glycosyltransferase
VAVLAAALLARVTRGGIGVDADSAVSIGAARNLLAGRGLSVPAGGAEFRPLVHFPPLHPLALCAGNVVGLEPLETARWISVLALPGNLLLLGLLIGRHTSGSFWPALLGVSWFALSPLLIRMHSFAMSEPPYLFLQFASLFLLSESFRGDRVMHRQRALLLASAAAAALAVLTRYVGVAGVITGIAALLLPSSDRPWRRRLRDVVLFAAIALLPLTLWVARNRYVAGTATNRELALHPVSASQLRNAVDVMTLWLFTARVPWRGRAMGLAVAGAALVAAGIASRRRTAQMRNGSPESSSPAQRGSEACAAHRFAMLLVLFCIVYVMTVVVSISLFDAATPLDGRMLSPVLFAALLLAPILLHALTRAPGVWGRAGAAVGVLAALVLAALVGRGIDAWRMIARTDGQGYTSRPWRESALVGYVRALPSQRPVYSNAPDALFFLTGRNCYWLPRKWQTWSLKPNPDFEAEVAAAVARLRAGRGVIAFFDTMRQRTYLPRAEELPRLFPVQQAAVFDDGTAHTSTP